MNNDWARCDADAVVAALEGALPLSRARTPCSSVE
jgi:hypothetical protein